MRRKMEKINLGGMNKMIFRNYQLPGDQIYEGLPKTQEDAWENYFKHSSMVPLKAANQEPQEHESESAMPVGENVEEGE